MKCLAALLLGVVLAAAGTSAAGLSCLTGPPGAESPKLCEEQCATVFDFSVKPPVLIEKGCSATITGCEANDQFCLYCDSDNCNVATTLTKQPCRTCKLGGAQECTTSPKNTPLTTGFVCSITSEAVDNMTLNARAAINDISEIKHLRSDRTKKHMLCKGANCNGYLFPLERKTCNRIKSCLRVDDVCQGIYDDDRGSLQGPLACSEENKSDCEEAGPKRCVTCPDTGCLRILKPPVCHVCVNDRTCIKNPAKSSEYQCKLSSIGCVVRINAAGEIARSCWNAGEECSPPDCKECATGDSCNNEIFPVDRIACHSCPTVYGSCDPVPTGTKKPCLNTEDKCFTKIAGNWVTRGCVAEKPTESANCPSTSCVSCDSVTCSQKAVKPATRLCHQCTKGDPGCDYELDPSKAPTVCNSKVFEGAAQPKCYQYIRDDLRRGCATDAETDACADGALCTLCDADGCNNAKVTNNFKCHTCSGANCEDVPTKVHGVACAATETECFTKVAKDGVVSRGCGADAPVCEDLSCLKCDASECNNLAVKETDIKCYQCKAGERGCDYELGTTLSAKNCGKFIDGFQPKCYQYIEDDVQRGCTTDAEKACADGTLCTLCAVDDCNKLNVKNNFKCHTCTGDSCADVSNRKMKKCAVTETTCFTTVVGTNVTRGCAPKVETEVKNCTSVSCTCLESECNNVNVVNGTRTCYKCDKGNAACGGRVDEAVLKPELCLQKVIGEIEPKCYEFVKKDVKRGCANTLNAEDAAVCDAAAKCKLCDSNGCNNNENSSATAFGAMFLIIAAVVTSLFAH